MCFVVVIIAGRAKCPLDPSLAGGSQGIEIIAADPDRLGADRERLEDMRPALHPAVHKHVDPITYGVDDFGQLVERCPRAVKLSAAMVGNNDAGTTDRGGAFGVGWGHDALQP